MKSFFSRARRQGSKMAEQAKEGLAMAMAAPEVRPLGLEHWEIMYAWRVDPVTVAMSVEKTVPTTNEHNAWMNTRMLHPWQKVFVYCEHGRPLGTYTIIARQDSKGKVEIHGMVSPAARRQGVGTRMARHAFDNLAPYCKQITTATRRENTGAKRILDKLGFRESQFPVANGLVRYDWYKARDAAETTNGAQRGR